MNSISLKAALLGAAFALSAAPALAQEDVKERAEELAQQANDVQAQAGALANEVANAENETAARAADGEDGARGEAGEARAATDDGEDDGFDWGLLGLLGLAGLLGLKRRDDRPDIRRDRV